MADESADLSGAEASFLKALDQHWGASFGESCSRRRQACALGSFRKGSAGEEGLSLFG